MIDERVVLGPATPDGPVAAEVRHAEMVLDGVVRQVRMLCGVGGSVPAGASEWRAVNGEGAMCGECSAVSGMWRVVRGVW